MNAGKRARRASFPMAAVLCLAACAGEPQLPAPGTGEVSFDGLVRVENSRFRESWIDPDADWARYDKILSGGPVFEFRATKKRSSTRAAPSDEGFWISDANKVRLIDEVSTIFREELARSERFGVADAPAEDTLVVTGGLLDVISTVPPDTAGRSTVYLRSVGSATLVVEVADSLSGEVLARVVERRAADRAGRSLQASSTARDWTDVRRLARAWAKKLREGIDSLPTE